MRFIVQNTSDGAHTIVFVSGKQIAFPELGSFFRVNHEKSITVQAKKHINFQLRGTWISTSIRGQIMHLPNGVTIEPVVTDISPTALNTLINLFIQKSRGRFDKEFKVQNGKLLVIKYMPANRLQSFLDTGQLYAGSTPGLTWGDAVYVTPLDVPFSTMMYGCVGVIGEINPQNVFDGSDPLGVMLYQEWIRLQFRWYDLLTTTIHSDVANRMLRNKFRSQFQIDCVFFRPDQIAPGYVSRLSDRWLALSHWIPGPPPRVGSGPSSVVSETEFCVVVSEEFHGSPSRFLYSPLLGAELRIRNTQPVPVRPRDLGFAQILETMYLHSRENRANGALPEPVFVTHEIT